jgi:glycosyltransferase involved in cell wall biosynthesis
MFEALRADPCRFIETLLDPRSLKRFWRAWRSRGTTAILAELSTEENVHLPGVPFDAVSTSGTLATATLLVIDATLPQFDRDAGGRSSFLYLQTLREMGHEVFFMPNDQLRREPYASILEGLGVKLLIGRGFRCGKWKNWLRDRAGQITHVILHRPNVAKRYLTAIRSMAAVKILYFSHDLRFLREMRHYELNGDAFHRHEAEYWEKVEKTIISQVDVAYFFSDEETKTVSTWKGTATARTVPLFPVNPAQAAGFSYAQRAGLLFVGGFSHQPNLDAVLWFAKEVFPLVRQVMPDIRWHIVGREPPPEISRLAGDGIVVEGAVSDARLQYLYQTVRLVIAPLRFGAGVKGKVVEAIFQGVPVVTTTLGAEGIDSRALTIADTRDALVSAIVGLYSQDRLWDAARANSIALLNQSFSREAAIQTLDEDLKRS